MSRLPFISIAGVLLSLLSLVYLLLPRIIPTTSPPRRHPNHNHNHNQTFNPPLPTHPYTPQIFETDLIFPQHNKTYAALANFPIVLGFQNPRASWPMHTILMVLLSDGTSDTTDGFFFPHAMLPGRNDTDDDLEGRIHATNASFPPLLLSHEGADTRYFIHAAFPVSLRRGHASTPVTGRYTLSWLNGFARSCRADGSEEPGGGFFFFPGEEGGQISFTIADGDGPGAERIEDVLRSNGDGEAGWSGCDRVVDTHDDDQFAVAWQIDDFVVIEPDEDGDVKDDLRNALYPYCPVFNSTSLRQMPVPRPCDLGLDEEVVEDILARANDLEGPGVGNTENWDVGSERGRFDLF
ncbi:hypothetical protein BJY01DRAFT_252842 [Aspergillus pseudoustus]|uniref:DUF7136 domain-containing protein n=1 Tax=Aspergillus pseudoustus TaxID=1810923 RepID=A0ABR4J455_9EURO